MRRLTGLLVLVLLAAIPAMAAVGQTISYADDFSQGGYSGNDGSLDFAGPWMEFGDSGGYESGKVRVGSESCSNNDCLHLDGDGPIDSTFGVVRSADLGFFTSAQLSFDLVLEAVATDEAELRVQAWTGTTWATLKAYDLSKSASAPKTLSLNTYLNAGFVLRFVVVGSKYTGAAAIDEVTVSGAGTPPPTTTTTTTTTSSTTTTTTPTTTSSTSTTSTTTTTTTPTTTSTTTAPPATRPEKGPPTTVEAPRPTTSTTTAVTSSSVVATTTTSTHATTTTTTAAAVALGGDDATPGPPGFEPGVHDMGQGQGVMVDYHEVSGDVNGSGNVEVLSAEVTANFSLAVEAFKTTKIWLAALSLMIAAALVSGVDRRRRVNGDLTTPSAGQPVVEG